MKKKELVEPKVEEINLHPSALDASLLKQIKDLSLNLDFGRQDLNDNFQKIQDKINELINR